MVNVSLSNIKANMLNEKNTVMAIYDWLIILNPLRNSVVLSPGETNEARSALCVSLPGSLDPSRAVRAAPCVNRLNMKWGPLEDSVQLVYNSNFTMVYGTQVTIFTGANLNQLIIGGPHIVWSPWILENSVQIVMLHGMFVGAVRVFGLCGKLPSWQLFQEYGKRHGHVLWYLCLASMSHTTELYTNFPDRIKGCPFSPDLTASFVGLLDHFPITKDKIQ